MKLRFHGALLGSFLPPTASTFPSFYRSARPLAVTTSSPAGFRWSVDTKPIVGTELCMHAHVGFLAHGEIHIEYADGCVAEYKAPQVVAIDPGHDGRVIGQEPAVLIEFDFEGDTIDRLGMPASHRHS